MDKTKSETLCILVSNFIRPTYASFCCCQIVSARQEQYNYSVEFLLIPTIGFDKVRITMMTYKRNRNLLFNF